MGWKMSLPKEKFEEYRNDPAFSELLALARVVNSLRFVLFAGLDPSDKQSAVRNRTNSFFVAIGILHEGFMVVVRLGKYFSDEPSFKNGLAEMRKSKAFDSFRSTILKKVRNQVSFHFGSEAINNTLKKLDLKEFVFVSGFDDTSNELHYELADLAAINYIIGDNCKEKDEEAYFSSLVADVADMAIRFIKESEQLIGDYLKKHQWEYNQV